MPYRTKGPILQNPSFRGVLRAHVTSLRLLQVFEFTARDVGTQGLESV